MNQSQELKRQSPKNALKANAKADRADQKKNRPDETYELSHHNTNQQIRQGALEEAVYTAYDAVEHHKKYKSQQQSFNEVQKQYEEQAYSSEPPPTVAIPSENGSAGNPHPPIAAGYEEEGNQPGGSAIGSDNSALGGDSPQWKSPSIREVESAGTGSRMFGAAETPELSKNTQALLKNEKLQEDLEGRRKTVQKGYSRYSLGDHSTGEKLRFRYYGKFDLTGEDKLSIGRLKYSSSIRREKMNRDDYEELLNRQGKRSFRRRTAGRLLFHGIKTVMDEGTLSEDELPGSIKRSLRRTGRIAMMSTRRNIRTLKSQNSVYARLDQAKEKEQVLRDKREKLLSDARRKQQKEQIQAEKSREQKKKLKKQMAQTRAKEEGNFASRTKQSIAVKRRARKERKQTVRRTISTIFAITGLLVFLLILGLILILVLISVVVGMSDYYASAVTQNDYSTLSDATGYYRKLETDMDEYLNADREALEAELEEEYGPEIYEYIYDLAEFGFSANTLMAYLSAVYGSFTLADVQAELDSLFEEMYTLTIKVELEDRVVSEYNPDTGEYEDVTRKKKICYVTLEKKELEEVVKGRMTSDQLGQYGDYRLSTGGQQVYSPVMREDWTNLISSNFGERIHPITKERKMHNGVDIAVPIGTHVYSAVDGTVILARYSESAGNWVKVQTETGWTVVMMHMDSLTVSEGQTVKKGDHLGCSGNTGRSTGPHLHLEVRDPSDQPMNPIFIIPQTCASIQGGDE